MLIVKKGRGCEFVVDMGEALCWFVCVHKKFTSKTSLTKLCLLSLETKGTKIGSSVYWRWPKGPNKPLEPRVLGENESEWMKRMNIYTYFLTNFLKFPINWFQKTTKFVEKNSVVLSSSSSSSLYITKIVKNKNKSSQFTLGKHKFPEIPHFFGLKTNKICRNKFSGPIIIFFFFVHNQNCQK